jgi:hypothetical protein
MKRLSRFTVSRWRTAPAAIALLWQPCAAAAASPILESEFIDPAPPYPQAHASTIVELGDGTLAAAWFGGSGEGRPDVSIWFARKTRQGWGKPALVADGRETGGKRYPTWNPVLFQPPGQPLHLFYKVGPNPREWHGMVITSRDGGRHWSAPKALPDGVLGPIKNKPIVTPGGAWLAPSSREQGTPEHNRWFLQMEGSGPKLAGRTADPLPDGDRGDPAEHPHLPRSPPRTRRADTAGRARDELVLRRWRILVTARGDRSAQSQCGHRCRHPS